MELLQFWYLFPIALLICIIVCTLAMEGAVLFTPSFLFLFPAIIVTFPRLTPNEAIGLALMIEFAGYSSSAYGYSRQRLIDYDLAKSLLMITVPLAIAARLASSLVPSRVLLVAFGLVLFILAIILFYNLKNPPLPLENSMNKCITGRDGRKYYYSKCKLDNTGRFSALNAGIFAGMIGIGVGEITNTLLMIRYRIPVQIATATSVFIVALTVLTASITHAYLILSEGITIPWNIVVVFLPAVLIGGQIAPYICTAIKEITLKKIQIIMFFIVSVIVLYRGLM